VLETVCIEYVRAAPALHIWYTHRMAGIMVINKISKHWGGLLSLLRRHGHHISLMMCLTGFVLDSTFLPSIDHIATQIISVCYFGIAIIALFFSQAITTNKIRAPWLLLISPLFPLIIQFVFGGLLSVVFVYYFRSASLSVSWPLILLLGALMAGNELWRKRLEQLEFQVTVLFLLFLFFSIFTIPLFLGSIGTMTFLLSVLVSIGMLWLLLLLLSVVAFGALKKKIYRLFLMPFFSALLVVGLYFANILPPIPLVTRADGVFHSLARNVSGEYVGSREDETWRQRYFSLWYPPVYHRFPGESIFFYSAVYAPVQLHTPIIHLWQYRDTASGRWVDAVRVEFPMSGGREAGYRGYSEKQYAPAGSWRVLVETVDGRTISRKKFVVVDVDSHALTRQIAL